MGWPVVVGLLLATALVLIAVLTANRQRVTLRRLREERFLPPADRLYFRGQVRRRLVTSVFLVVIGGMIGGYYLSGMDDRMNQIGERKEGVDRQVARADEPDPNEQANKEFTKLVGWYWIGVLGLVFVVACLAVLDFWATRVYWMARYREIKADHETKLQRDLAVYRQQKLNDRMKGKRRDDPDETPPPG